MPGWGTSGRVRAGSTVGTVYLDTPVTFQAGLSYHLYLRFDFDADGCQAGHQPWGRDVSLRDDGRAV